MPAPGTSFRDAVDNDRREVLETLVSLVREGRHGTCWGSEHAGNLLRSQSSMAELKELGVDFDDVIAAVWGDVDER